jgi:flagellar basal-body rod protein FlgF
METGIYAALSRETGLLRDLEVTSNNLANMTTDGFQGQKLLFSQYLAQTTQPENKVALANDKATVRDTRQGTLQITNGPLDAAIEGKGYFAVSTPLGVRYTRNGHFQTNQDGELVTSEGHRVLDETGQPITFDPNDRVVQLREDGSVNVDNAERARLKIVQFADEQSLEPVGATLLRANAPEVPAQDFRLVGGALERSNVNSYEVMTHLVDLSRSINDVTNFITAMYGLEQKASDMYAKNYS